MARQEEECQELGNVTKQENLLAMMEQKKSSLSEAPKDIRKQIFKKSGSWTKESLGKKYTHREKTELG